MIKRPSPAEGEPILTGASIQRLHKSLPIKEGRGGKRMTSFNQRKCPFCGTTFEASSPRAIYCGRNCRMQRTRDQYKMIRLTPSEEPWREEALCKEKWELFFPKVEYDPETWEEIKKETLKEKKERELQAQLLCSICPVKVPCLEDATARGEVNFIWGGVNAEENIGLRRFKGFASKQRRTD